MGFNVGDKVVCVDASNMGNIRAGVCYSILDIKSDGFLCVEWDQEKSIKELGSYSPWRFRLMDQYPITEARSVKAEHPKLLEDGVRTGTVYGILFECMRDSDEDLWEIAEKIVDALGKVEENL